MNDKKFLGICIVASAIIVSAALILSSLYSPGRYQFQASTPPGICWVLDTMTGDLRANGC